MLCIVSYSLMNQPLFRTFSVGIYKKKGATTVSYARDSGKQKATTTSTNHNMHMYAYKIPNYLLSSTSSMSIK